MSAFVCRHCTAINRVRAPAAGKAGTRPVCGRCKQPLDTSGAPIDVDAAAFDKLVASAPVPVLVDFWAPWCGPCRMVAPVLDQLARAHAGALILLKVNSDDNPAPSQRHGIRGIPSLLLFRGGREVARQTGALPRPALEQWLAPHLRRAA